MARAMCSLQYPAHEMDARQQIECLENEDRSCNTAAVSTRAGHNPLNLLRFWSRRVQPLQMERLHAELPADPQNGQSARGSRAWRSASRSGASARKYTTGIPPAARFDSDG